MRGRVVVLGLVLAACAPAEEAPPWRASEGLIRDAHGRAVIMRGVNLSGSHKRKPYFGFHQAADFARIRTAWGMNAVRLLVSWAALEPSKGSYDGRYLDELERRVDWAEEAGLLVVLDMHQDVYGEGFGGDGAPRWTCDESLYAAHKPVSPWFANYSSPSVMACFDRLWTGAELQGHFVEAWRRLALRFSSREAVVGFDVLNEPHWGSASPFVFEAERLGPFYDKVVRAVREQAPRWLAFLEPAATRNLGLATKLKPSAHADVVYAPHSYDMGAEQGQGFDAARRGTLVASIAAMAREARGLGAALWIGEYGGNAGQPGIAAYMDAQYDGAAEVVAGSMYWEYDRDAGYGLLNPDGSEKKALLDVLVRPYPERVAGVPARFSFDEGTRRFVLSYRPDGEIDAPTEVVVPRRVYASGFKVACGACRVERLDGRVRIWDESGAKSATVEIGP